MPRGTPHSERRPSQRPVGGRAECASRYVGQGRKPAHPISVLPGSDADIEAKTARADRGEQVHRDDDELEDPSVGLVVRTGRRVDGSGGHLKESFGDEVGDQREDLNGSATPPCWESLSLGARIKQSRKRMGLSYRTLAARLAVAHTTLIRWEQNVVRPRIAALLALAAIFNVAPGVLLDGLGKNGRPNA